MCSYYATIAYKHNSYYSETRGDPQSTQKSQRNPAWLSARVAMIGNEVNIQEEATINLLLLLLLAIGPNLDDHGNQISGTLRTLGISGGRAGTGRALSSRTAGWSPASGIVGDGKATDGSAVHGDVTEIHVTSARATTGSAGILGNCCARRALGWRVLVSTCNRKVSNLQHEGGH